MKVYRVIDDEGRVVYSNRNIFGGLYTELQDAERARAGFQASWQRSRGPFTIQESEEFGWNE